jgi:hypothetical protein
MTKWIALAVFILLISVPVRAQYPYHKAVTIKSNLLSLCHVAVEFPVYKRLTAELGCRYMHYSVDWVIPDWDESRRKYTFRANVKYHYPMEDWKGKYYSVYAYAGVDNFHNEVRFYYSNITYGITDATRFTWGLGTKRRRYDLWFGCEKIIQTRKNQYEEGLHIPKKWLPDFYVSGGVALNLINFKL